MSNATISVANVENCHHSTRLLAQVIIVIIIMVNWSLSLPLKIFMISICQTSLRNILGTKNLHEILSDRESIALAMQVTTKIIWTVGKEGVTSVLIGICQFA